MSAAAQLLRKPIVTSWSSKLRCAPPARGLASAFPEKPGLCCSPERQSELQRRSWHEIARIFHLLRLLVCAESATESSASKRVSGSILRERDVATEELERVHPAKSLASPTPESPVSLDDAITHSIEAPVTTIRLIRTPLGNRCPHLRLTRSAVCPISPVSQAR